MRIQDLFQGISPNQPEQSEATPSSAESAAGANSTNPQTEANTAKIGIAKTADQFESFKPTLFDQMVTTHQTMQRESRIYSNEAEKQAEMQKLVAEEKERRAKQSAYVPTSGIPIDEPFRRNVAPADVLPKGNDFATTVPGEIWRANINPNVLIPPSPTKTFRSNLEFYLTNLAGDQHRFHDALSNMYGENYEAGKAEAIRKRVLGGDFSWLPKIEASSNDDLKGHFSAVDRATNTIYINESKHQPVLGKTSNAFDEMNYSAAYGKALWAAMRTELDPVDADKAEGKNLGTIYVNGKPRNVEWVDVVDVRRISNAVISAITGQENQALDAEEVSMKERIQK